MSLELKNCLLQKQNEISLESVSLIKYRPTYKLLFHQCVVIVVSNILHCCVLCSVSMVETVKEIKSFMLILWKCKIIIIIHFKICILFFNSLKQIMKVLCALYITIMEARFCHWITIIKKSELRLLRIAWFSYKILDFFSQNYVI